MFQPFEKSGDIARDRADLLSSMRALLDPDPIANYANASALLNWYFDDINWVGFYLWNPEDRELVLGPFQGLPACIRIRPGRGVCGTAIDSRKIQLIDDVLSFPGHIACDSASRSELVVPIYDGDSNPLGVLDIDSPSIGRFSSEDSDAMEEFCRLFA